MALPNIFIGQTDQPPNISTEYGPAWASPSGGLFATSQTRLYTPRVLSSSTGAGGGGGATQAPQRQTFEQYSAQAPQQNLPSQPSVDWNAMYAPAFSALEQFQSTLQPTYETTVKEAERTALGQKGEVSAEEAKRLGITGQNRAAEETRTKGAIAEARRLASEAMQGIQARFGGTTGAGGAYSEILGAQATRNIAASQQALQQTMMQIHQEEAGIRDWATRSAREIDDQLETAKEKTFNWLQGALAGVAQARGTLETEKAQQKINLLNNYHSTLQQIEAQNTAFKQQLFLNWQTKQKSLDEYKASMVNQYQTALEGFSPYNFNVGETPYAAVPKNPNLMFLRGSTPNTEEDESLKDPWSQ